MELLTKSVIIFVALQHLSFLVLEMFFWCHPIGLKVFGQSIEKAMASRVVAANQGLYNGFLSAGLIWSLAASNNEFSKQISLFFLSCVFVAGLYGGYSVTKKIFFVQGIPALVGLILLFSV